MQKSSGSVPILALVPVVGRWLRLLAALVLIFNNGTVQHSRRRRRADPGLQRCALDASKCQAGLRPLMDDVHDCGPCTTAPGIPWR